MTSFKKKDYGEIYERLLARVQKPARYAGGEWNSISKDWEKTDIKIAFAFPDVYEVGMSHLGLQILYHTVNQRPDTLMERVFAPWTDMEKLLREHGLPLLTLESRRPLGDFDMLAFTLQYEMSFTNVLNMLDLAGMPLRSSGRGSGFPLVIAGGPCAFNPEPMADFIDAFAVGEGEELFHEIIDVYKENRGRDREFLLRKLAGIEGVYVPGFYRVRYSPDGAVLSVSPSVEGVPAKVTKRVITGYDRADFPVKPIVPNMAVVHDRIMLEVMRGCSRGCRFCQAGAIYRPVREKSPETLIGQAGQLVRNTGYDEISLTSLSSADYSEINRLVKGLLDKMDGLGVGVSLPSLRVDAFSVDLAKEVQRVRRSSLTFAPEAGTQRLRDVINKGVTGEDLLDAVSAAFGAGWQAVKLYFMIGLPTETREDLDGIASLAGLVLKKGEEAGVKRGRLKVTVSVSSFVPKSHTPFQWEPQNRLDEIRDKQNYLKSLFRDKRLAFKWHDPEVSFLEAVLARGDRRLSAALEKAWQLGSRFEGWSECFDYNLWLKAFADAGLDPEWYAYRRYDYCDVLPWDHIEAGVDREFLVREHRRALEAATTPDCRRGKCPACGVCTGIGVRPEISSGGDGRAPLPDQLY
ncbi:MAG: TIGR03960 family B12-binding radical SAM protein [Peptococcaceae bacterium]|nr:TIGR03960 family B12-binding radical SAM protein [Peptococcaceae bacterium]